MLAYILPLLCCSLVALTAPKTSLKPLLLIFVSLYIGIFVGLRENVGGDWVNYLELLELADQPSISSVPLIRDPSYLVLSWISVRLGLGIYGVNLVCALLFSISLLIFCSRLPRPFIALTLSLPYSLYVLAMGYTRQSVAVSLIYLLITFQSQLSIQSSFILLTLATSFQQTTLVCFSWLLPQLQYNQSTKIANLFYLLIFSALILALYFLFLNNRISIFFDNYLGQEVMNSSGAVYRVILLSLPSILFLTHSNRLHLNPREKSLMTSICLYTLICLLSFAFIPSSTVIDRLALYALPILPYVGSHLPELKPYNLSPSACNLLCVGLAIASFFAWILFSPNAASSWLPYRNILLEL